MELSEATKIIRDSFLFKDANEHIHLKEAISTVLRELESACKFIEEEEDAITERNNKICELEYKNIELQKENELARKSLIENSNIADERNDLLVEVQKLKKENEELKTDTRNRAIGCRDLVKKCEVCDFKECIGCEYSISDISATLKNFISKDKIKEKIEELKAVTETCYGRIKYQEGKIAGLEELLKGE